MDKRLVAFIQRAVQSDRELFLYNASWQALHREFNVGSPLGTKIRISAQDKTELAELVLKMEGVDVRTGSMAEFSSMNRHESLQKSRQEKWAGKAVASGRILLKSLPDHLLVVNGKHISLPERSHLDIAHETIVDLGHDAALVVENYECFDRIHQIEFGLAVNPVIVYRGDPNASRANDVMAFIKSHQLSVLALVDIDPAGLVIAQSLPGVVGVLAPSLTKLDALLQNGSLELYRKQRPGSEQALRNSQNALIRELWAMIEHHQAGLVQERWLDGDVEIVMHPMG